MPEICAGESVNQYVLRPLGIWLVDHVDYVRALFRHLLDTVACIGRPGGEGLVRRTTMYQLYFTGVDAIFVVASLALVIGAVIIVEALSLLTGIGNEDYLGTVMELVVVRELGPVMTALIVIGRSGSSITVELGNMRVGREVALLESLGIDLQRYLVLPRMVGVTIAIFCLCVVFDVVAVLGGYAVARMVAIDTPLLTFLEIVASHLTLTDLLISVVKTLLFGLVIATVSTYQGMAVHSVVTEVPQATRRSVVHSLVLVVLVDFALSLPLLLGVG